MIFRGIKQSLFFQFWILFFLAMLLVDVLMLFIFLERTISQKIDQKMYALIDVCQEQSRSIKLGHNNTRKLKSLSHFNKDDAFLFVTGPIAEKKTSRRQEQQNRLDSLVSQTLLNQKKIIKKHGTIIGLFFFQNEFVIITYPVNLDGKTVAAGGIEFSLREEYQNFNQIQKIALVFIVINSFFLAMIGNHQLSRFYYRPLKRLAMRAEAFREEDNPFFAVRKEDNEFSVLSSSLNKMLNRIAQDKNVLKNTIGSLKKVNNELKIAQNDVIRAEKMASVGRLTSGIAHEIGNPIGIVLGYLDLLKQTDLSEGERGDFIERSEKEITRINNIIRQLLDMSRSSAGEAKPVSIHQLLEDLVSVFGYQPTASHISFHSTYSAIKDYVFADPDQLRQVFLNILLNAVDAVNTNPADGACITLITQQSETIEGNNSKPGRPGIKVTIKDNGPGIDSSHLSHVFDPFYTTKQPGQGTGLGLSVSFMIVERLGGHISVDQHQALGAAFHVTLPLFSAGNGNIPPDN